MPVAVQRGKLELLVQHPALTGRQESLQSRPVVVAISRGDDRVGHRPAQGLRTRPAENLLGTWVPVGDPPRLVHADACVVCGVEDEPGMNLTLTRLVLSVTAAFNLLLVL